MTDIDSERLAEYIEELEDQRGVAGVQPYPADPEQAVIRVTYLKGGDGPAVQEVMDRMVEEFDLEILSREGTWTKATYHFGRRGWWRLDSEGWSYGGR